MLKTKNIMAVFAVFALVMLAGEVLIYAAPYSYDSDVVRTSDGLEYSVDSPISADYNIVALDNGDRVRIDRVYMYYDAGYPSINPIGEQGDFIKILEDESAIRGLSSMYRADADGILKVINDVSIDPRSVAVLMCSGSFPEVLYDGTEDSPILRWLGDGGTLIWIGGPMGSCYSDRDHMMEAEAGYEELFFGEGTGGSIRDDSELFIASSGQKVNPIDEALSIVMNDATYGVNTSVLDRVGLRYLPMGYISDSGFRCSAMIEVPGGSGMIMLFGTNLNQFYTEAVAQSIAAGLNYESELVGHQEGSLGSGKTVGDMRVPSDTNLTVYLYLEKVRLIYARTFSI